MRFPLSFLFSRLNSPSSLILPSCGRCCSPFIIVAVVHPIRAHEFTYVQFAWVFCKLILLHTSPYATPSLSPLDFWRPVLQLNTEVKMAFATSAFSTSCVTRALAPFSSGPTSSFCYQTYSSPSCCSLNPGALWLSWSCPCMLRLLYILLHYLSLLPAFYSPFLWLSLDRSSSFIHTGLLAFLPDFLLFGMDCSWAWRRWSWNINQCS